MTVGTTSRVADLEDTAHRIRVRIAQMCAGPEGGHLGGGMSVVDILTTLYFGVLNVDPAVPDHPDRDVMILSKGHAGVALYATLCERGFFGLEHIAAYGRPGTLLGGHPTTRIPGVEVPTGSLGHGLGLGVGLALAHRSLGRPGRVVVVMGDGELQEGSVWEAALIAGTRQLSNLTVVVDRNHCQQSARTDEIATLEPLASKWGSFGWSAVTVDGHDVTALVRALRAPGERPGGPLAVVAETTKARGVPFMENDPRSHYVNLNNRSLRRVQSALGAGVPT
jgi:transketolase